MTNYFGFNKQQRNGLVLLVGISFLLLVIRIIYPYFIKSDSVIVKNLPLYERQLDSASKHSAANIYSETADSKVSKEHTLFKFDPNTVSHEQLLLLGFKKKTADVFIKFRNKGFVFRQKEDLKKVYGVTEKFYVTVEPYINIVAKSREQSEPAPQNSPANEPLKNKESVINLNKTDSLELISISGIGPSYARRIIKYRQLLGGYVKVIQLREVYGMTLELYDKIEPLFFIGDEQPTKINLNSAAFKDINKHPYISYELCKIIVQKRTKNNLNLDNLKVLINDSALYSKLIPYLAFD